MELRDDFLFQKLLEAKELEENDDSTFSGKNTHTEGFFSNLMQTRDLLGWEFY